MGFVHFAPFRVLACVINVFQDRVTGDIRGVKVVFLGHDCHYLIEWCVQVDVQMLDERSLDFPFKRIVLLRSTRRVLTSRGAKT